MDINLERRNQAIRNVHPNVTTIRDGIAYENNTEEITQDTVAINAEVIRLKAEYDSQDYARKRKAEYDQLNQFELQFDDQRDGTTTWVDAINAIKAKYPKP